MKRSNSDFYDFFESKKLNKNNQIRSQSVNIYIKKRKKFKRCMKIENRGKFKYEAKKFANEY